MTYALEVCPEDCTSLLLTWSVVVPAVVEIQFAILVGEGIHFLEGSVHFSSRNRSDSITTATYRRLTSVVDRCSYWNELSLLL
jgi:hypothetical protein